jgi:hypothetical protein
MQNARLLSEALAALAAARLAEAGLPADYGLPSLEGLDELIDECPGGSRPPAPHAFFRVPHVPPEAGAWLRVVQLGCYLGEVLRRRLGGEWLDPLPTDPGPGAWALVGFPNGTAFDPVWAVTVRVEKGWPLGAFARVVVDNAEGRAAERPNGFGGPAAGGQARWRTDA